MEPEFWDPNPNKVCQKIFPPSFLFKPLSPSKTQRFYEFILIDSHSVSIKHNFDKNDNQIITHSTFQILKVLTFKDFEIQPNKIIKFSQPFDPIGYNYWDYQAAWTNVFWFQNKINKHSWLIYFKRNVRYFFPQWFAEWWDFFGPIQNILPEGVKEGYNQFKSRFEDGTSPFHTSLHFFSKLSLAWIFAWQHQFKKQNPKLLPTLGKQPSVKWWDRFDASRANTQGVALWFQKNPKSLKVADPETSRPKSPQSTCKASTGDEALATNLQQILGLLQTDSESSSSKGKAKKGTSSSSSSEEYSQNEDDCFGINLNAEEEDE
ncbi:hypothetical protein Fmac_012107 [Flemingia macrophylla]|uniref:Uncharacterized protein n=1 Tax=Flemingia macrophylla TaxID=520843 RepID=A0ABD1MPD3_9FABA